MRETSRAENSCNALSALVAITLNGYDKGWFGYSAEGRLCLYVQPQTTGSRDFKTCILQREKVTELPGDALRAQFPYIRNVLNSTPGPFRKSVARSLDLSNPFEVLSLIYLQICSQERRVPKIEVLSWLGQGSVRRILLELLDYLHDGGRTSALDWFPWEPLCVSQLRKFAPCNNTPTQEFVALLGTESPLPPAPLDKAVLLFKRDMRRLRAIPPPDGYARQSIFALVMSDDPIDVKCFYSICKSDETGLLVLVRQSFPFRKLVSYLRCLKHESGEIYGVRYGFNTPFLIDAKNIMLSHECLTNERNMHSELEQYREFLPLPMLDTAWWTKINFNAKFSDIAVLDEVLGPSATEGSTRLLSLDSGSWNNRFSGFKAAMLSDTLTLLKDRPYDKRIVEEALQKEHASATVDNAGCAADDDDVQGTVAARPTCYYAGGDSLQSRVLLVGMGQGNFSPNPTCSQPYTAGVPEKFSNFFPWSYSCASLRSHDIRLGRDFAIKSREVDSSKGECYNNPCTTNMTREDDDRESLNRLHSNAGFLRFNEPDGAKAGNRSDDEPADLLLTVPSEPMQLSLSPPEEPLDLRIYSKKKHWPLRRNKLCKPYAK